MPWFKKIMASEDYRGQQFLLYLRFPAGHYEAVIDHPDCKTENGTTTISYTLSKSFSSPEKAEAWLRKNLPSFQFEVTHYAIADVYDLEHNVGPDGHQYLDYQFPFQWKPII